MRRSRKGSLELSVNAIVILVMAIAILGLGLAFIRGALTKGQAQVFKAIDNAELENPATADHPTTIDKNVQVKVGSSSQIKLGFYNTGSEVTVEPVLSACSGKADDGTDVDSTWFTLSSGSQTVAAGKAVGYQGLIAADKDTALKGSYVCTVDFVDSADDTIIYETGQFFLTVTS